MFNLDELIGNDDIKNQLVVSIRSARLQNSAMRHALFAGLAGCGKTTTAGAVSVFGGFPFIEVNPQTLRKIDDLLNILYKLPTEGYDDKGAKIGKINPGIIFIDEAHKLSLDMQETLGKVMREWKISYTIKSGQSTGAVTEWTPEFSVICATTMMGELSKPFRDRFQLICHFSDYNIDESYQIVLKHASKMSISISDEAAREIAKRGRRNPRILVNLLMNAYDHTIFLERDKITADIVFASCQMKGIDSEGLDSIDTKYLTHLATAGRPTGIDNISVRLGIDSQTIIEVHEPYLLNQGFIDRTRSGRVITPIGIDHLKKQGVISDEPKTSSRRILI